MESEISKGSNKTRVNQDRKSKGKRYIELANSKRS